MDSEPSGSSWSRPSPDTTAENLAQRLLYRAPVRYTRPPGFIPFHIPHRKILDKHERKLQEELEPLIGFGASQKKRRNVQVLPPIQTRDDLYVPIYYPAKEGGVAKCTVRIMEPDKQEDYVEEEEVVAERESFYKPHRRASPVISNQLQLINQISNTTGFLYMIYSAPQSSEYYTPYTLRVVPYENLDKNNFMTMSAHGVTHYYHGGMVFTPLTIWKKEYETYTNIIQIRSFSIFRMWKGFYVWRKNITRKKFSQAQKAISENLFILNIHLRKALLDIQAMIQTLIEGAFTDMTKVENFPLFDFIEVQMGKMESVVERLTELRGLAKEIVINACHGALLLVGFTIDDSNFLPPELSFPGAPKHPKDTRQKMSFTDQANKRRYCEHLTCFIHLVDIMQLHLLHVLSRSSLEQMEGVLHTHFQFIPSEEKLNDTDIGNILEDSRPPESPQLPLFVIELLMDAKAFEFDPSEEVFLYIFDQLLDMWDENLINVRPYMTDPYFCPFTEPMINGKQEECVYSGGTNVMQRLVDDIYLIELRKNIVKYINENFVAAFAYTKRFEFIRQFFAENDATSRNSIRKETDLQKFRDLLKKYHEEINDIRKVVDQQYLGLLLIQFERFKEMTEPNPTRLLTAVENALPMVGKTIVNDLMVEAGDAQAFLEVDPKTTIEYVEYIDFVNLCAKKVDVMDHSMDYCKDLYDIMEEFEIPISPEDMNNYLGFSVTLSSLRNLSEKKSKEKDNLIAKFNEKLSQDISSLIGDVGDVKDEATQPWLIDIESNPAQAKMSLKLLFDQLSGCLEKANQYKLYQRQFKVDVTRFDMLDEVVNDVKLRQLLWESVENWANVVSEWHSCDFNTLDPESVQLITSQNIKNINQLEKGLPKNQIVPQFKDSVELMKEKLPVITNLRNPALRPRHWIAIEHILNYKFKPDEELTLKLLEDVGAFTVAETLQEISAQASSEASLEQLLKKVEDTWKSTEFIVLPHRDYKDIFILAGIEEVQLVLDDTNISINTIASSRHVGPIKPRVDEWVRLLDLFSRTLVFIYLNTTFCIV